MHPELAFKAISLTTVAVAVLLLLVVLLISLRKELSGAGPVRGLVHLGFAVIAVSAFIALMAAHFQARKVSPHSNAKWIDTAGGLES
jgi:hypothetical protein